MNVNLIENGMRSILEGLGVNYQREDLLDTPKRAAKFLSECLANEGVTNAELVNRYAKCFPAKVPGAVIVRDIPVFSFCEHHIALMYDMRVSVAYWSTTQVLGLSKVARLADAAARRLQIQERLTSDIAEMINLAVAPRAVVVRVRGKHSCVTARGVQKDSVTETMSTLGDPALCSKLEDML